MPKRKSTRSREKDIDHFKNKIKKLERKIRERQLSNDGDSKNTSEPEEIITLHNEDMGADTPTLRPDDWLLQWPEDEVTDSSVKVPEPQPGPSTSTEAPSGQYTNDTNITDLDAEILEILGDDPSNMDKYGPEVHSELASRLLYIAKEGLSKENRKELITKYPVPANCVQIDAPKINLEIKAAIADAAVKRDRGIEIKQKQMTCAIACLTEIMNTEISSKTRNNYMLKKLMDLARILCDLQHADSITRRNFILFTIKDNMKGHLKNTKIDTFLFGENLSETLRSAKAVNKSGVELKSDLNTKIPSTKHKNPASRPLNRKAPPQARRQFAGPAPQVPRSRHSAAARAPYHPPPPPHHQLPPAHLSRILPQPHQATYPRRRY